MNESSEDENLADIELAKEIHKLNKYVEKLTSPTQRFFWGIIQGFGSVIGATVLVSILLYILAQLAQIGVLKPFIDSFINFITTK